MNTKVAGIYITRQCNLKCDYCNAHNSVINELDTNQWIKAINIIEHLGIENLTLLGGEPTLRKDIVDIVRYIVKKTNLKLSLVTNATANFEVIKKLTDVGLENFSASIDAGIYKKADSDMQFKSERAIEYFSYLQQLGIKGLRAYCVLSASTMPYVVDLLKELTKRKIDLYLLPYHWNILENNFWETRSIVGNPELEITKELSEQVYKLSEELLDMKKRGYRLANTDEYINKLPEYIMELNWHCGDSISELRIDADGTLMCCHDYKGKGVRDISIFDLADNRRVNTFVEARKIDIKTCPGCYWPSQYISLEKMLNSES